MTSWKDEDKGKNNEENNNKKSRLQSIFFSETGIVK
jgi:hypothetical protein